MFMLRELCLVMLTICAVLCAIAPVDAQTQITEKPKRLSEIVVTATRRKSTAFETPYITETISSERFTIEKSSRSIPSALESLPGVMGQKTAFGQQSPFIRGFTGFRTLLLVDGVRINHSVYREGPNQYWGLVDPLATQRLELLKGPASAIYGSDAVGGTANALVSEPSLSAESSWSGRVYYRFSSAEESHIGRIQASANFNERSGFVGGISYKMFGDLRAGEGAGQLSETGYDDLFGDVKFIVVPRKNARLTVAYQHAQQKDVPRWHSTIYSKSYAGTTLGTDLRRDTDQHRDFVYARIELNEMAQFAERAQITFSYQNHRETEWRVPRNGRLQIQSFDVDTLGVALQMESPTPRLGTWTYGVDYYRDWVDTRASRQLVSGGPLVEQPRGPVADDATCDLLGVFAQDELSLGDKWLLILGGRYTYACVDANKVLTKTPADFAPITDDWHALVSSGRVLYRLDEHWHAFAGVSQGFRAPNLSDLTRLDSARSGEIETPSPGLKPERYLSYEIGLKTLCEKLDGYVAYFYTTIDGMIVRYPTGAIIDGYNEVTKANSGNGYVQGVELSGEWKLANGWSVCGDVTWMEGRLHSPIAPGLSAEAALSRVQPLTGHMGIRWLDAKQRFWCETSVTLVSKADKLAPSDLLDTQRIPPGGTPGYGVWGLRGGWNVSKFFSIFAAVENLLDKDYRVHGSGINEPGRNLIVGCNARF